MPSVKLSWTPRVAATTQRIYRSTSLFELSTLPSELDTVSGDAREYIDDTVVDGTEYFYGVSTVEAGIEVLSVVVSVAVGGFVAGSRLLWDQFDELADPKYATQENGGAILLDEL